MRSGAIVVLAIAALALAVAPAAAPSNLIDRNARGVKLEVSSSGIALLTYRAAGRLKHVLAWGAVDAHAPTAAGPQRAFRLDYSGGWKQSRKLPLLWQRFQNACGPYRGPALAWLVTACTAPDGSHWAVQSWQRMLPNFGVTPFTAQHTAWELRLSHWSTELPTFTVKQDWAYRRFENLYGSYSYLGQPMFGFRTNSVGAPLDNYGVLIHVDTLNSRLRTRLETRERLRHPQPDGNLLLRLLPPRRLSVRSWPGVSGHGRRRGRSSRPDVGRTGARPVRRRARRAGERRA